jgi:hypothetical protein
VVSGRFLPFNLLQYSLCIQNYQLCSFYYWKQCSVTDTIQNACQRGDTGSVLGQALWDLLWTKWHWGRFVSEYFTFPQFLPWRIRQHVTLKCCFSTKLHGVKFKKPSIIHALLPVRSVLKIRTWLLRTSGLLSGRVNFVNSIRNPVFRIHFFFHFKVGLSIEFGLHKERMWLTLQVPFQLRCIDGEGFVGKKWKYNRTKIAALLGIYAAFFGSLSPTFREKQTVTSSRVILIWLLYPRELDRLVSRNVANKIPI